VLLCGCADRGEDANPDAPRPDAVSPDAPGLDALAADAGDACADERLCAAPTGLAAAPGDGRVTLTWSALPTASITAVVRGETASGPWSTVGTTAGSLFVDASVVNGTTYWYAIAFVRKEGEGPRSAAVAVTPIAPPEPPTAIKATSGDGTMRLEWTPGARASATRVRRVELPLGAPVDLGSVSTTTFLDAGLTNGTRYAWSFASENSVGASAWTAPVEAAPIATPTGVVAIAGDRQAALFWGPCVGATSYEVERAASAAGPFAPATTLTSTGWTDKGLTNGTPVYYRISAISPAGRGAASKVVSATPAADATPLPPPEGASQNRVGLNLWFNTDWDGTQAFVDVFKSSRPWQDGADWHKPVAGIDALGWPTADASTVVFSGKPVDFNGTYKLAFEGQADVSVMWAPGTVAAKTWDPATNTTRADVTFAMASEGSVGLVFKNTRRDATSPIGSGFRRARLYRPGYPSDGSVTFTAPVLAGLGRAKVVRMMEWAGGGSNVVQRWGDRVTPAHATQGGLPAPPYTAPDGAVYKSGLGVALEHQIELCNRLMVDCWLQVPPVADDEYVRKMALSLRFGTDGAEPYASPQAAPTFAPLHPSLRAYVELGNENWNSGAGFLSFHLYHAIAAHLPPTHPVLTPKADSIWTLVWRYPAFRTAVISDIFRAVFGDAQMMTRVRPVLMTQIGNAQNTMGAALTWLDAHLAASSPPRAIKDVLYAGGGSGYYGVNSGLSALPDSFFAAGNYPDAAALRAFALDSLWAANAGIRHVAYEGGPGLSYSAADNRALAADPRMRTMMEATHAAWSQMGGDLLVYYTLRGPSEWEFTPDLRALETPKLRALDAIQSAPRAAVTLGGSLPGALVARDLSTTTIRSGFGYDYTVDGLPCAAGIMKDNFFTLPGHASAPYTGKLVVRGYSASGARLAVWINGARQGEVTLAALAGTAHLYDSTSVGVAVPAGLVAVRLEVLEGSLVLYSIGT
jgi:fibronectin type 3 domain-containing protein